jgi:hypothetical protein
MPATLPTEVWKVIQEFPDYAVSNLGRVKRTTWDRSNRPPKILKGEPNHAGYTMVALYRPGKRQWKRVSRLVAMAFLEPDFFRDQVNHKNGDKADDRAQNLEWTTCSENHKHSFAELGRATQKGELHGAAKLKATDVLTIRQMCSTGSSTDKEIADCFGVCRATIYLIRKKINWKHF